MMAPLNLLAASLILALLLHLSLIFPTDIQKIYLMKGWKMFFIYFILPKNYPCR